jgi:hypothetical protein
MDTQNPNDTVSASPTSGFHVDSVFAHVVRAPEDPILGVLSLYVWLHCCRENWGKIIENVAERVFVLFSRKIELSLSVCDTGNLLDPGFCYDSWIEKSFCVLFVIEILLVGLWMLIAITEGHVITETLWWVSHAILYFLSGQTERQGSIFFYIDIDVRKRIWPQMLNK